MRITEEYPRNIGKAWKGCKKENGKWDGRELVVYKCGRRCYAEFVKRFVNESAARISRPITEAQFENAKELLHRLYVKSSKKRDCKYFAQRIEWFCAALR